MDEGRNGTSKAGRKEVRKKEWRKECRTIEFVLRTILYILATCYRNRGPIEIVSNCYRYSTEIQEKSIASIFSLYNCGFSWLRRFSKISIDYRNSIEILFKFNRNSIEILERFIALIFSYRTSIAILSHVGLTSTEILLKFDRTSI